MNIFLLDYNIRKNAEYHCDQHVNKMILEAAQMICTVASEQGITVPYKATHPNHPCTKWLKESFINFEYLVDLAQALNEESKLRYNRKTDHKSWLVIDELISSNSIKLPHCKPTLFVKVMPEEFKKIPDTVEAYRTYYKTKTFATWKNEKPYWI